ncbi:hypothetical protein D9613_012548 [Agrocybe pediades]|uniref:T6SS Phospholipase effector Tle1-like catalytic domain-containing protein n=1 Tax=Agrocybe pediades TaxID=84607 RepID=A0A8H4QR24_9AGAR|nr:hypothetical protein D9613_012548 [Agrocybe pediades]
MDQSFSNASSESISDAWFQSFSSSSGESVRIPSRRSSDFQAFRPTMNQSFSDASIEAISSSSGNSSLSQLSSRSSRSIDPHATGNEYNTAKTDDLCCHWPIDGERRRNLVISIDGTSNKFGAMNTNVIEHHSLLIKDGYQIPYYNSGIGTYARPSWTPSLKFIGMVIHHKIDLAIAWDFDKTVKDAYRWISENYEDGDLLFMFGFSRGAFQVRVLSAMIQKVGLLHRGNELQIPFAYELYCDPATDEPEPQIHPARPSSKRVTVAERFKLTFSRENVKVHFVGVWDTVSSIGTVRGAKMLPGTIDGMKHVCFFRHALALDERRVKFLPEYANGGKGPDKEATSGTIPHTKEVWFAGTHSDIGGGNTLNPSLDRTRPPLRWMVYEAEPLGLRTSMFRRDLTDDDKVSVKESLSWVWWPFEFLPFRRLTYTRKQNGKETTHNLHRGKMRKIHLGQKIHNSAILVEGYIPGASLPPCHSYSDIFETYAGKREGSLAQEWVELPLVDHITEAVNVFTEQPGSTLDTIAKLLQQDEGRRAFYEAVFAKLKYGTNLDQRRLMEESVRILGYRRFQWLKMRPLRDFMEIIEDPSINDLEFLVRFSQMVKTYPTPRSAIHSLAFSPSGRWLASGHDSGQDDCTIYIWNVEPGSQSGIALGRICPPVMSAEFSPDGRFLVSGSSDRTIRLWNVQIMQQVGKVWRGHTSTVNCVVFSPDGTKVVSASDDGTLRIWNPETGKEMAVMKGHGHKVQSVAFSPDGLHVVSGSWDHSVRIWDARTYQQDGDPIKGHTECVSSVAYSPDGMHIASGSWDNTIRIWNAHTREQVGEPLRGHSNNVTSVCFSPNWMLLASGSYDHTIRIWNPYTGEQIGGGLRLHDSDVWRVAFSHDGRKLASASDDGTILQMDIGDYLEWALKESSR